MRAKTVQKRNAFTLVELLVVIAIILILMALTVGVLSKVWRYWDETQTNVEINRLAESCNIFKSTFGRYPPARIMLCENWQDYAAIIADTSAANAAPRALALYSVEYLTSIFPGIGQPVNGVFPQYDWNGNLTIDRPNMGVPSGWCLEGEEALVFFLGGMRTNGSAALGFNTDKSRPTVITGGARLGPFFQFDEGRVKFTSPNALPPQGAGWPAGFHGSGGLFPVYEDKYGTPYAYFLARTPGTNNYFHPGAAQFGGGGYTPQMQQYLSDCFSLTRSKESANLDRSFVPFWQALLPSNAAATNVQYFKADTFQIVSAGKDKLFGCGGNFNATNPEASIFDYMNPGPPVFVPGTLATAEEKKAVFDNLSNVTNGRAVPE